MSAEIRGAQPGIEIERVAPTAAASYRRIAGRRAVRTIDGSILVALRI